MVQTEKSTHKYIPILLHIMIMLKKTSSQSNFSDVHSRKKRFHRAPLGVPKVCRRIGTFRGIAGNLRQRVPNIWGVPRFGTFKGLKIQNLSRKVLKNWEPLMLNLGTPQILGTLCLGFPAIPLKVPILWQTSGTSEGALRNLYPPRVKGKPN